MTAVDRVSPLRRTLEVAQAEHHCSMKDLTVLAVQNDPYRIDTPARHRDGEWLAITARELGLGSRPIHLRGLHYMVLGQAKPDGRPYTNTDPEWNWLQNDAGKAARWLGYIPFDQIVDQRNSPPELQEFDHPSPWPFVSVGVDVDIPSTEDIVPTVGIHGFTGVQPYKLVLIGEKSSLNDVLGPLARSYGADLWLPTGEISDTYIHRIAQRGAQDGRPMRLLYFADADPSGWQMPISVGRKLQAFKTLLFPDLEFAMFRVGLIPEQVREHGLPSTPLKESERRGDDWRAATGTEQTEIDALAALRPDLLRQIARQAMDAFYDHSLDERVFTARSRWLDQAQAVLDAQLDGPQLAALREQATARLDALEAEITAINEALRISVPDVELPPIVVPEPQLDTDVYGVPLLDSRWSFRDQCRAMIDSKAYRDVEPRRGAA